MDSRLRGNDQCRKGDNFCYLPFFVNDCVLVYASADFFFDLGFFFGIL